MCQEGCYCQPGFIRHNGTCISDEECDAIVTPDLSEMTECQQQRVTGLERISFGMIGGFVPNCEPNGDFSLVQCHASTGFCWCANPNGAEIMGTRIRGEPDCQQYRKYSTQRAHNLIFTIYSAN